MSKKLTDEQVKEIIKLHGQGLNNSEIARLVGITNATVGKRLRLNGLSTNKNRSLEIIDGHAECKTCRRTLPITRFQFIKGGSVKYPHYSPHCRVCTSERATKRLNNNLNSYIGRICSGVKSRSKLKNLDFALDSAYLTHQFIIQNGLCFYTEMPLVFERGVGTKDHHMSLDRVDVNKGYIKGNVVWCTRKANVMKNNAEIEELKIWTPTWYERIMLGYESGLLY